MANEFKSKYADCVGEIPLPEYPRPQLVRDSYLNLNGKWEYAIRNGMSPLGLYYDGYITVPFSPETTLSGVFKYVSPEDKIFYQKIFEIPEDFLKDVTLLHFTAVDYECTIKVNGLNAGSHKGGFMPFTVDVSTLVHKGTNQIELLVKDPTDTSYISRGKQSTNPGNIWYTPQSGIWGTVWMESCPESYVKDLTIVPDIDNGSVSVKVDTECEKTVVRVYDGGKLVSEASGNDVTLPVPDAKLWSPESPFLYDLEIETCGEKVTSYFGMRKFSVERSKKDGIKRLHLNNEPYFHNGVLDQGYWPESLLTPPCEQAMIDDIQLLKDMGFTMVRKHIKIEPLRWYYHCDRLGILVWQDMVSGGEKYNPLMIAVLPFLNIMFDDTKHYKLFGRADEEGRKEFEREALQTVDYLKNVTSIAMWVPFNEGWGQFDSDRISELIAAKDPTRTIDRTSGWHDQYSGDFVSKHIYFTPIWVPRDNRCYVLSEFGGFSKATKGHMMAGGLPFGYRVYPTQKRLEEGYRKIYEKRIIANMDRGLSACVFTQLSDVEGEINGLVTYDRKVDKMRRSFVKSVNDRVKY